MAKAESVACYRHKHCGGDIRIKTKHQDFFFYFRYRREKKQQRRTANEYDNTTFASDSLNIGELNLDPNRFQVVWL